MARVFVALLVLSLCACARTEKPMEPPAAMDETGPGAGDWRSAAANMAKRLAQQLRDKDGVVVAGPRQTADYFTDLLLQDLFQEGVPVAAKGAAGKEDLATVLCRTAQFGVNTRSDVSVFGPPGSGIALVCSVTWHGKYVAAADYVLTRAAPRPSPAGILLRVTQ